MRGNKPLVMMVLLAVLVCLPPGSAALAQQPVPRFEPGPCPGEMPGEPEIACGTLVAPLDHDNPADRTARLPVVISRL